MLILEQTVEIQVLKKQGKSLRQIAHVVGVSVNTVRKYLKSSGTQSSRYKARPVVVKKLDPYKDYLKTRVKSAHPMILPATVLLKEIRDLGYLGQLTQLRGYLRSLRPVQEPEQLIRFETPPGKQMQVDFIEFRKGKNPLAAFVATLGFSRASYVEFVVNQKVDTLIQCHKNAFDYFGGVPSEVLYDNMLCGAPHNILSILTF